MNAGIKSCASSSLSICTGTVCIDGGDSVDDDDGVSHAG